MYKRQASYTYEFTVPDPGTYWFHPHVGVQLDRGLYGALIVRAADEPVFDAERPLVLDDVELEKDGQIKPPGGWIESHDGREGSTRLVNGKREPEIYGRATLADLEKALRAEFETVAQLDFFQSNHEGALIDRIAALADAKIDGLVINLGAYHHTTVALPHALARAPLPRRAK